MKTKHISNEGLINYLENPIGIEEDETMEGHLFACDRCGMEFEVLEGLTTGIKRLGSAAIKQVKDGRSECLKNSELSRYVKDGSNLGACRLLPLMLDLLLLL